MSEKLYEQYYKDLYSLQNSVFELVEPSEFYLTGGTALSRFYTHHRYSDDLDFFIHKKDSFLDGVKEIISEFKRKLKLEIKVMTEDFAQVFVHSDEFFSKYNQDFQAKLKVEFVNEKEIPHFGDFNKFEEFSRIDNLRNILSNKITAITRMEAKDIADIWFICRNFPFNWNSIIEEAEKKEAIEELLVFDLIKTFPLNMFEKIRWVNPVNKEQFEKDREKILADLVSKGPNSLAHKNNVQNL